MIKATNISVNFRNARSPALSEITFMVECGEHIAILGPNGSGKSTLLKAMCGFIPLASGEIRILGKKVRYGRFGHDFFGEIGVVFQEPQGQFLSRDVKTEIMTIFQNLGLPYSIQIERFDEIVSEFGLEKLLEMKPDNLSGGQMQLVNLAGAVCLKPQLLLLDEPTTFLDPFYKEDFLARIDSLGRRGLTLIHITQYPDEALLASRIIALNDGKIVFDGPSIDFLKDEGNLHANKLVKPAALNFKSVFGFGVDEQAKCHEYAISVGSKKKNETIAVEPDDFVPLIKAASLGYRYKSGAFSLKINNLTLNSGEIVGLIGPAGSGKSTLAFLLTGLLKPQTGDITIAGKKLGEYGINELRKQIGISWQLPDLTMIGPTVKDDLEFNLTDKARISEITSILSKVGLDGFENRIVDTLSGGEKRKLALASLLLSDPKYLILDEPEAFLDPWSQQELIKIIRAIAGDNRGILVIAHDLSFLSEISDRIIGLQDGNLAFDIPATDFFSNTSFLKKLGLPGNRIIEFRQLLTEAGLNLNTSSLSPATLKKISE